MRYLNYAGVDVNRPLSQSGITPLHYAIAMGDLDEAEWLCNHGALLGVKAARFRSSGADTQPDAWQQNARSANEIDAHGSPGIPGHQRMLRGLLSAGQLAQETLPGRQADRLRSLARFHERHHRVSLLPWLNQGILILTTLTVDEVLELGYSAHFGVPGAATGGVPVTIALNRPVVILGLVGLWLLSLFTLVAVMKGPGRAVVSAEERTGTFCSSCKAYRPKRARHCYFSGHCVPDYNLCEFPGSCSLNARMHKWVTSAFTASPGPCPDTPPTASFPSLVFTHSLKFTHTLSLSVSARAVSI